jgi:hypothetical protein
MPVLSVLERLGYNLSSNEVGRWRGTIAGPAPSASSRTTQDRFRVMWLSSRDIP